MSADMDLAEATYPIYVGKAIPKGGRKGTSSDASLDSTALSKRLQEHKASIESVGTLKIEDFTYRSLVVDDIWISLGETLIIQRFQPLWNQVVDGFGNHDPGGGRYSGMRPAWDELHPGRAWATRCQAPKLTRKQILQAVDAYMEAFKKYKADAANHHAFGTFGTSAAEQPLVPKASGDT